MSLQRELDDLATKGGTLLDADQPADAQLHFDRGVQLARTIRDHASLAWFLAHRGFAYVRQSEWALAVGDLTQSILLGQLGNPYVHMMRGIALYELGDLAGGKDELFKAAALVGPEVFAQEDPKYWAFAIKGMKLPEGCADWEGWEGCEPESPMHQGLCDPAMYRLFLTDTH